MSKRTPFLIVAGVSGSVIGLLGSVAAFGGGNYILAGIMSILFVVGLIAIAFAFEN